MSTPNNSSMMLTHKPSLLIFRRSKVKNKHLTHYRLITGYIKATKAPAVQFTPNQKQRDDSVIPNLRLAISAPIRLRIVGPINTRSFRNIILARARIFRCMVRTRNRYFLVLRSKVKKKYIQNSIFFQINQIFFVSVLIHGS